jgi:hypothetical protein
MDIGVLKPADRNVEGIVEMMFDATQQYNQKLIAESQFAWNASPSPTGLRGMSKIRARAIRISKPPLDQILSPVAREGSSRRAPLRMAAARLPQTSAQASLSVITHLLRKLNLASEILLCKSQSVIVRSR